MTQPVIKVFKESFFYLMVCILFGVTANALSPSGIRITNDFFHLTTITPKEPSNPPDEGSKSVTASSESELSGNSPFTLLEFHEMKVLFEDPSYEEGLILFIDARNRNHYEEGHIPGAYRLDHFHPEETIEQILLQCEIADKIVVYCTGGECEDSILAAGDLTEFGIDPEQISIFKDGITEWQTQEMPIDVGPGREN
ncbi:MAG TPA: hypothetical protein EYQ50_19505 [Verrucomicrobiales bacterium]|nr:hypothetical protein [Verrucomicrobiales bacterium]HIL71716.1 hypothetical protein [Verrucomicrobiota bacterium]